MTPKRPWLTAHTDYKGFPIYFRRPDVKIAEFATLQLMYPRLLVATHVLKHVKDNGLPESGYNQSLEFLDAQLTAPFDDDVHGLVALIETFAGKRTYYIYISPSFDVEAFISGVKSHFPVEELTYGVEEDPSWRLFRGYATDFGFA